MGVIDTRSMPIPEEELSGIYNVELVRLRRLCDADHEMNGQLAKGQLMSQLDFSSTSSSPRRCSAAESLINPMTPQTRRNVVMLHHRNHGALSAANAKVESRWSALQLQRQRCSWA